MVGRIQIRDTDVPFSDGHKRVVAEHRDIGM
jgi:hypothetical protein